VLSSYHYVLGLSGKRLSVTDQTGAITSYGYDNDGRLTKESSSALGTVTYSYDNVGNRLNKSVGGTTTQTFTYDADDRVLNTGYSYDANGNVKSDGNNTYTWDWENVLTESDAGTGNQATYVSDANGLRIQQTNTSGTTNYTVDEDSGYGNVVEERSAANTLIARYDYGDDLLRMDRGTATSYYLFDGLGSTRLLTDQNGNVTDTDSYDAYGNVVAHTGTTVNPYLFDGQEEDGTGLYYLRARYMDPGRGEFLGQDPFEGDVEDPASLHRYLYASDDPADFDDPSGSVTARFGYGIEGYVRDLYKSAFPYNDKTFGSWQYYNSRGWVPFTVGVKRDTLSYYKPDIFDITLAQFGDVKPLTPTGVVSGFYQISKYGNAYGPAFTPLNWDPPFMVNYAGQPYFLVNVGGIIFYSDIETNAAAVAQSAALGLSRVLLRALITKIVAEGPGFLEDIRGLISQGESASVSVEEDEDVAEITEDLAA
jgi:RHS repeat-associated protein